MQKVWRSLAAVAVLATAACGGDSGTGPSEPSYASIAGSYGGPVTGLSQGIGLDADLALTLTQSRGSISGTYALDGVLFDNVDAVAVAGSGTITGTIASGNNPSVNLTIRSSVCPNYTAQFSGAYDSANRRLTITGPLDFFQSGTCNVGLRFQGTFVLAN